MRSLRAAILAGALVLAACQSNVGRNGGAKSDDPLRSAVGEAIDDALAEKDEDQQEVSAPMKERQKAVTQKFTRTLLVKCIDADAAEGMEACFRERVLAGFDKAGIAAENCPPALELGDEIDCIAVGAYAYEFVRTVSGNENPAIDWADPERSLKEAAIDMVVAELGTCLGGSSASDPTECLADAIARKLGLSESEIAPCKTLTEDRAFGQCIGEAYGLRFMEQSIARM